jgi:hypothetical protein
MAEYDPLSAVDDQPIAVDETLLAKLRDFRAAPRLQYLPGVDVYAEKERLSKVVNRLLDTLIELLPEQPTKHFVMKQFQYALVDVRYEETEGREHFGMELEQIMDILGIDSSDGLLNYYLVGF